MKMVATSTAGFRVKDYPRRGKHILPPPVTSGTRVLSAQGIGQPDLSGIPAEIVELVYLGELTQLAIRLESGHVLTCRQITEPGLREGAAVMVRWAPENARVVPETTITEASTA